MFKNKKNYFSFFGILLATIIAKLSSECIKIVSQIKYIEAIISKKILTNQINTFKHNSTNNI